MKKKDSFKRSLKSLKKLNQAFNPILCFGSGTQLNLEIHLKLC